MTVQRFESVELLEKRFNFFPSLLRWHGRPMQVERVDTCRVQRGGWLTPWRRLLRFRVRTGEGSFDLLHDPRRDAWRMAEARAERATHLMAAAARPRYPLPFHQRRAYRLFREALSGVRHNRTPKVKTRRGKVRRFRLLRRGAT